MTPLLSVFYADVTDRTSWHGTHHHATFFVPFPLCCGTLSGKILEGGADSLHIILNSKYFDDFTDIILSKFKAIETKDF